MFNSSSGSFNEAVCILVVHMQNAASWMFFFFQLSHICIQFLLSDDISHPNCNRRGGGTKCLISEEVMRYFLNV